MPQNGNNRSNKKVYRIQLGYRKGSKGGFREASFEVQVWHLCEYNGTVPFQPLFIQKI